jgi:DNA-binding response OmpR family regulator/anti-sigma regulatory factor (Ser/Thr protein kinase)
MIARALVVDGSSTVRMELCEALEAVGLRATACRTAAEARDAAAHASVAVVVVDASLPDGGGLRLLDELRAGRDAAPLPGLLLASAADVAALAREPRALVVPIERPFDVADLARRAAELATTAGRAREDPAPAERAPRLLLVDDSATFRAELAELLASEGYDVDTAASGEDALARLAAGPVDAVLLDMIMPGLGGTATCARIKADPALRAIPVLMLTAREGHAAEVEGLRAGADDFATKGGDPTVLEARVRAHVRRRRIEEDHRRILEELLHARAEAAQAGAAQRLAETRARLLADLEAKNAELERAKARAEDAVRARDEFLLIAAHELKTPLTSLLLQLQSADRTLRKQPPQAASLVSKIEVARRNTERLASLIETLLDVSRMSAQRVPLAPEWFDLGDVARSTAERLGASAAEHGTRLRVDAPAPVVGRWDRTRCEQAVVNLVANAIKYGDAKPVDVEVSRDGDRARVVVRDRGIGVPEGERERIFGLFERAVSTRNYGGLGLGLYVTRQIAEAHGGTVGVARTEGGGSTFTIELPIERAAPAADDEGGARMNAEALPPAVLVVDDDRDIRETLCELLEDEGYRAVGAGDGREAIATIRASDALPALILLDLMMPTMDGLAFRAEQLQVAAWAAIPTVVLSAFAVDEAAAIELAAPILKKPIAIDRLLETVARHCGPAR